MQQSLVCKFNSSAAQHASTCWSHHSRLPTSYIAGNAGANMTCLFALNHNPQHNGPSSCHFHISVAAAYSSVSYECHTLHTAPCRWVPLLNAPLLNAPLLNAPLLNRAACFSCCYLGAAVRASPKIIKVRVWLPRILRSGTCIAQHGSHCPYELSK